MGGLALSGLLGWLAWSQDRERQRTAVIRDAEALEASLQSGVLRLEDRIRSATALMANTRGYDPATLALFDSLVSDRGAVPWRAIAAGPLLRRSEQAAVDSLVASRRATYDSLGYPAFRIFPDRSDHPEMLAILLVQPRGSRQNVFGYDMMSEPGRRRAVLEAAAGGLVELSPPVTLSQDAPSQAPSLILVSAFRRSPAPMGSLVDSLGVVATSFTPSTLVEAALDGLGQSRARLEVSLVREGREILSFMALGQALRADGTTRDPAARLDSLHSDGARVRLAARGETHEWMVSGTLRPWEAPAPTVPGAVAAGLLVTLMALILLSREQGEGDRLAAQLERQGEELRASEARAARLQRSEALGRLTGGIAHDFNNLLSVILGNLDLMKSPAVPPHQRAELCDQVERAAERAASLTQSLLTFGRRARLTPRTVEVGRLLSELTPILRTSVPESIGLDVRAPEEPLWVRVDPVQLESALLNLVVNARDACGPGDVISVRARRRPARHGPPALDARELAVCISVEDTGTGMPADVLQQAADPFFTTKPPGRGSGLGLATTAGFLRQSGGDLELDSVQGRGTTVRLWLPWTAPEDETVAGDDPEMEAPAVAGVRLVLVEDDEQLREVLTRGLERAGCRVRALARGAEAVQALAGDEKTDVVVSDLVMPGPVSGVDVAEAARARGIPAILVSGYAGEEEGRRAMELSAAFLRKPLRMDELLQAVARVRRR